MSPNSTHSYDDIYDMLREVHTSWTTEIMDDNGEIMYYPKYDEEIEFS